MATSKKAGTKTKTSAKNSTKNSTKTSRRKASAAAPARVKAPVVALRKGRGRAGTAALEPRRAEVLREPFAWVLVLVPAFLLVAICLPLGLV